MPYVLLTAEGANAAPLGIIVLLAALAVVYAFVRIRGNAGGDKAKETPGAEIIKSAPPRPDVAGEFALSGADDKTAAALIAITAEKSKIPLNDLKITSVRRIGAGGGSDIELGRNYQYKAEEELTGVMKYKVTLNNSVYEVTVEKGEARVDTPSQSAAPPPASGEMEAGKTVRAPLSGTILNISVNPGDAVKSGDVLLILEALKMENEIVAPFDAVIAGVQVSKGDTVNANDIMITLA